MFVSVEASRLTFPEAAVLFSLEPPKGSALHYCMALRGPDGPRFRNEARLVAAAFPAH